MIERGGFVRPLVSQDVPSLQVIDLRAHGDSWTLQTYQDQIDQRDRTHFVADVGGVVVGHAAAWVDESCCRITNVAVDQDHAGNGYASALLGAVIESMLTQHRIRNLQLEVRPLNRRAQRLYRRFGFMPVGIDPGFYDHDDEQGSRDALIMAVTDVCDEGWRAQLAQQLAENKHRTTTNRAAANSDTANHDTANQDTANHRTEVRA